MPFPPVEAEAPATAANVLPPANENAPAVAQASADLQALRNGLTSDLDRLHVEIDRQGELWKQLERSGNLALHVAGDFPGLELELWALRQPA